MNTFWTESGTLVGDNTDVGGFHASARTLLEAAPTNLTVAVIGAGGAAAAVLGAVEQWPGSTARVFGRTPERASMLAKRFGDFARAESTAREALRGASLVVNATPVGMTDEALPFDLSCIEPGTPVLDLVYRPGGTALTKAAQSAGHRAADGKVMLLEQGALAFERWFGIAPDREAMRGALG